ncbi:MAG: YfhO family protein [Chloroflexi bacterium]|nr:YfhO family protein [Chloroflexota bacterium]
MSVAPDQNQPLTKRTARLVDFGCAGLLALFVLALYARLLFTNRVLASGDILLYFYPYRDYASAMLRAWQLPLWNPYSFLGVPFLANPQAAVLYPLHWPLSWLSVTKQVYWSAAFHTWLLGMGGYFLLRRWQVSAWAGLMGGLVLAGSGFYGGLIGHLNQMNGAAWLPWALLILDFSPHFYPNAVLRQLKAAIPLIIIFGLAVALMVLAGHTQTAYINLFGIGVWTLWPAVANLRKINRSTLSAAVAAHGMRLLVFGLGSGLGLLLSAAQLLPTLELSSLGFRSGGLTYAVASSFSLKPLSLPFTLLPTYGLINLGGVFGVEGYTEFVAYVGLVGILLAGLGAWKGAGRARTFGLLFAGLGLFLAIGRWNPAYFLFYKMVPGFALFRTPARWMMLYTMGMAVLAGAGIDYFLLKVKGWHPTGRLAQRTWLLPMACTLLIALDLILAARALPHTQPTAPQAVYDLRSAPAHLLTDPVRTALDPAAMGRFLSMSTTRFDPGDAADLRRIFRGTPSQLDEGAFAQLLVALKEQEILAPNLPLLWRIPAVDGFDGGVLPLQRYINSLTLFVSPEHLIPDGRLREQVKEIPNAALLALLNVQYVITDKVRDLWFEDVYYDRQIGAHLRATGVNSVQVDVPQPLDATAIGLIGYIEGSPQALQTLQRQNVPVAAVTVHQPLGATTHFTLTAGGQPGANLADSALDSPLAISGQVKIAYRDVEGAPPHQEYLVHLALPQPMQPLSLTIQRLDTPFDLVIQAATLIDTRTHMFTPLLPSDRGQFRLVHSGDVKLYENLDVRPRAYLAHHVVAAASPEAALELLRNGQIDADQGAVVEGLAAFTSQPAATDQTKIIAYHPEQVTIQIRTAQSALLVLSDSAYPGWSATLDDQPTPIYTTNYLFRGVSVPAGDHTVSFRYQPASWRHGLWISGLSLLFCLLLLVGYFWSKIHKRSY